jgi:hypothetical protein
MEVKTKYQRPQVEVVCFNEECGNTFLKDGSEVRRNLKLGRNNFCSLNCSSKDNIKHLNKGYVGDTGRRDKYTGLREHLNRVRKRDKVYDITLDDLLTQWNKQNGICPYTGLVLIQPKDADGIALMFKASLDRVDSDLGYVRGNIQFISASANLAKNNMTHEEMIEFCKLITNHWSNGI